MAHPGCDRRTIPANLQRVADGWVKGTDGEVAFDGEYVRIRRHGFSGLAKGAGRGELTIPTGQVTGIELKEPGLTAGRFTIVTAGTTMVTGPSVSRARRLDPMTVMFQRWHREAFTVLRDRIQHAIANRSRPQPAPAQVDLVGQLQQLAELHQQGALSEGEYQQAKARLLG